jgi:hypothetical protein
VDDARRRTLIAALLVLAIAIVYRPAADADFLAVYDDVTYVTGNPHVAGGSTVRDIGWAFTSLSHASNWHPVRADTTSRASFSTESTQYWSFSCWPG